MVGGKEGGREGKKDGRRKGGKGRIKDEKKEIFVVFSPLLFFSFSL